MKKVIQWKKTQHKHFPEKEVKWRRIKDFLGIDLIEFKFDNGEISNCNEKRFNSLFNKIG